MPCPSHFYPKKETQYPLYRGLGGPQGQSRWVPKISLPPAFDPQTIQPVVSRYTTYTIPAHLEYSGVYETPARIREAQ
jgi:hypothetical protein